MDQQAALRWVQHNIGSFGGDRGNVTIAGQSAGGLSVLAQLVSATARGLFQRAIVQSGAFALTQKPLGTAEAEGNTFAAKVGCASDVADCLRAAPVADLVNNFGVEIPGVVDGAVLTETIGSALAHQRFARVPVMNGITHDEELLFIDGLGIAVAGGTNVLVPADPTLPANYQPNIAGILGVSASRAAIIAAEYPLSRYPSPDVALSLLVSDSEFACPALQADRWTSARVPTFAYQFNDDHAPVNLAPPGALPPLSTHGTELPYLFDQPNAPYPAVLDPSQQALASTMRTAWTQFAAVGNPSTRALPWPAYNRSGLQVSLTTPKSTIDPNAYTEHHCGFWAAG
jgi:para-nitrobenzyl esterase